jgi:hypothetical protein
MHISYFRVLAGNNVCLLSVNYADPLVVGRPKSSLRASVGGQRSAMVVEESDETSASDKSGGFA